MLSKSLYIKTIIGLKSTTNKRMKKHYFKKKRFFYFSGPDVARRPVLHLRHPSSPNWSKLFFLALFENRFIKLDLTREQQFT